MWSTIFLGLLAGLAFVPAMLSFVGPAPLPDMMGDAAEGAGPMEKDQWSDSDYVDAETFHSDVHPASKLAKDPPAGFRNGHGASHRVFMDDKPPEYNSAALQ